MKRVAASTCNDNETARKGQSNFATEKHSGERVRRVLGNDMFYSFWYGNCESY